MTKHFLPSKNIDIDDITIVVNNNRRLSPTKTAERLLSVFTLAIGKYNSFLYVFDGKNFKPNGKAILYHELVSHLGDLVTVYTFREVLMRIICYLKVEKKVYNHGPDDE